MTTPIESNVATTIIESGSTATDDDGTTTIVSSNSSSNNNNNSNTTASTTTTAASITSDTTTNTNNEIKKNKKKNKVPPPNLIIPPPRPQLTKAERRAIQEQQRAAKAGHNNNNNTNNSNNNSSSNNNSGNSGGNSGTTTTTTKPSSTTSNTTTTPSTTGTTAISSSATSTTVQENITSNNTNNNNTTESTTTTNISSSSSSSSFISHLLVANNNNNNNNKDPNLLFDTGAVLRPIINPSSSLSSFILDNNSTTTTSTTTLHPAIIALGYQYANYTIRGCNARCRAMLQCYCIVLQDYLTIQQQQQQHNLVSSTSSTLIPDWKAMIENTILKPAFTYWTEHCRTHSVTMGNAITFLKTILQNFALSTTTKMKIGSSSSSSNYSTTNPSTTNHDNTTDTTTTATTTTTTTTTHSASILALQSIVTTFIDSAEAYIRERIDYAKAAIAETVCTKLLSSQRSCMDTTNYYTTKNRTVLLTYGHSEAVETVLIHLIHSTISGGDAKLSQQQQQCKLSNDSTIRIIIVDNNPLLEGRILLQKLQREVEMAIDRYTMNHNGIDYMYNNNSNNNCGRIEFTYIHLHAITYVLPTVSKVLLGAASLQSDGSVMGRAGTAMIAYAAYTKNIPVLICTETYKISNRNCIPLESLTQNELYNKPSLCCSNQSSMMTTSTGSTNHVKYINLLYDITPASYVSGIVTELGIVPPSSVAVLLREMNQYK